MTSQFRVVGDPHLRALYRNLVVKIEESNNRRNLIFHKIEISQTKQTLFARQ